MAVINAQQITPRLQGAVADIAKNFDADFYIYNGPISLEGCDHLMNLVRTIPKQERKKNAVLVLTTLGGNPDDGFRAMQFFRRSYQNIRLYIFGNCKSAGTMMAVGAHEIVMGDFGEFGPLDVQISLASDSGLSSVSGLTYHHSMQFLSQQTVQIFQQIFQQFVLMGYTKKQASDLASKLCVDIISPISSQIDPQRLGEFNRAMQIAAQYCQRLQPSKAHSAGILAAQYPSHTFVIAREEARNLLGNVREPNCDEEYIIEQEFHNFMRHQFPQPPQVANQPKQELFIIQRLVFPDKNQETQNASSTDNAPN
jgi:hypothetical protein